MGNGMPHMASQTGNIAIKVAVVTAVSILLSVTITAAASYSLLTSRTEEPLTPREYWNYAMVISVLVPALVAPVVSWRMFRLVDALGEAHSELARLAATDQLTKLYNRRGFEELAEKSLREAEASREAVAMLMCDIDHFKSINDRFGHEFGDHAIRYVASILAELAKEYNAIACRHGGEEFALLMPKTSAGIAKQAAERLRLACSARPVVSGDSSALMTISVGVAAADEVRSNLGMLLNLADSALYRAKKGGRNQVVADPLDLAG